MARTFAMPELRDQYQIFNGRTLDRGIALGNAANPNK